MASLDIYNEFIGWLLVVMGIVVFMFRRKRAFENPRDPSYWKYLSTKTLDRLFKYLSFFFLIGGFYLMANNYQDSWGAFVLIPVYGFMIFLFIGT